MNASTTGHGPLAPHSLWSTASFGDDPETSPMELARLGEHLDLCQRARGRLFVLQCKLESTLHFFTARVVTSAVLLMLVAGAVSLAL